MAAVSGLLWLALIASVHAQSDTTDTVRAARADSLVRALLDSMQTVFDNDPSLDRSGFDSLFAKVRADSAGADSTPPVLREFHPPAAVHDSALNAYDRIARGRVWPLPAPADMAAGDLAGWLVYHPLYDVDDAPGPGQARLYTHWGLAERRSGWTVDGRSADWQRLSFPQTATFDPAVIAPFDYDSVVAGDRIVLARNTEWPYRARSSFVLRQGDFGESYTHWRFKNLFPAGTGIDLGLAFDEGAGRFAGDDRDNRYLRLHLIRPLRGAVFWRLRFFQFRDKTMILTPREYAGMFPRRDDLLYSIEGALYRPTDSVTAGWTAGLTVRSGKQDIRDIGYHLESHDRRWSVWGRGLTLGWLIDLSAIYDQLEIIGGESPSRWGASLEGRRTWKLGALGAGALSWTLSDWDTDPVAVEFAAALSGDNPARAFVPSLHLERTRIVPSLFDRAGLARSIPLGFGQSVLISRYTEAGDPDLQAEWRNRLSVAVASSDARSGGRAVAFHAEMQATYAQRYTRWEDTATVAGEAFYQPRADDIRSLGFAAGMYTPLIWKLNLWASYAVKYAETLDHQKLSGYYPQKASAIVSWIAPRFRYEIDLRINSAFIWWYGDRRIAPTPYTTSPHVLRWDISASARMMQFFTFYYSIENVTGFLYRTRAGQEFTGRTMRFGFNWQFID